MSPCAKLLSRRCTSSPLPQRVGQWRCVWPASRIDSDTGSQCDSSWCRAQLPRCGRKTQEQTGGPRALTEGCPRWPSGSDNNSTWTQWRWCSWLSTRGPHCVCQLALRSHLQSWPKAHGESSFIHCVWLCRLERLRQCSAHTHVIWLETALEYRTLFLETDKYWGVMDVVFVLYVPLCQL